MFGSGGCDRSALVLVGHVSCRLVPVMFREFVTLSVTRRRSIRLIGMTPPIRNGSDKCSVNITNAEPSRLAHFLAMQAPCQHRRYCIDVQCSTWNVRGYILGGHLEAPRRLPLCPLACQNFDAPRRCRADRQYFDAPIRCIAPASRGRGRAVAEAASRSYRSDLQKAISRLQKGSLWDAFGHFLTTPKRYSKPHHA